MNIYYKQFIKFENKEQSFRERSKLVSKYAWAIPTDTIINKIVEYSPIIEIGAGTGYWSMLIQSAGGKIMPFEKHLTDNPYKHDNFYTDVFQGDESVLRKFHSSNNLFLCWPPYGNPMALNCLKNFKGKYVLYIGEGEYGCTADDEFHDTLNKKWDCVDIHSIPKWEGLRDEFYIYKRR